MAKEDVILAARRLAARAHEGQTRFGTNAPYISHPAAVVHILEQTGRIKFLQGCIDSGRRWGGRHFVEMRADRFFTNSSIAFHHEGWIRSGARATQCKRRQCYGAQRAHSGVPK